MAYFCQNRLAIVLKQAAQSCKTVVFRWRNRAIYSLEKQPLWFALPETPFSLFTASQILFPARWFLTTVCVIDGFESDGRTYIMESG